MRLQFPKSSIKTLGAMRVAGLSNAEVGMRNAENRKRVTGHPALPAGFRRADWLLASGIRHPVSGIRYPASGYGLRVV